MGYNEDYRKGHQNPGTWSNQPGAQGANDGARAGQQDYDRRMREVYAPVPSPAPISAGVPTLPGAAGSNPGTHSVGRRSLAGSGGSDSLWTMAKAFSGLGAVGCAILAFAAAGPVNWPRLAGYALLGAVVGGLAGAALYVAIKVVEFVLKAGAVMLGVLVLLHLLGVVDMFRVLTPVAHWVGSVL